MINKIKKKVSIVIDVKVKGNNESDFNPIILFPLFFLTDINVALRIKNRIYIYIYIYINKLFILYVL